MAPLDQLLEFLRIPSISTVPAHAADTARCAEWVADLARGFGFNVAVEPTPGHPIVTARGPVQAGRRTVLVYGHYDVQPVDPLALWTSPPFEPAVRDGCVFARGASDNKGQILAHLLAAGEVLRKEGDLPVNLIFLIEGEEEVGSTHFGPFLSAHRAELGCDVVVVSDSTMIAPGVPTVAYGLRGITGMELVVRGPDHDLHSGCFGGAVANPATVAARLVAALHDASGRIVVPGFHDRVRPLEAWEREAWRRVPYGDTELLANTGAPQLVAEPGFTPIECVWGRPTAEVNGIGGGYQGEGSKTVIPSEARVKLTFRLVPDQHPDEIAACVGRHFRALVPPSVSLEIRAGHGARPYLADPNSPFGTAARRALRSAFGREPLLIREGGSIPLATLMRDTLGVDTLLLGLALPDCNAHAPDESFPIANLEAGMRMHRELLRELATL